jgi:hypothetical protein
MGVTLWNSTFEILGEREENVRTLLGMCTVFWSLGKKLRCPKLIGRSTEVGVRVRTLSLWEENNANL